MADRPKITREQLRSLTNPLRLEILSVLRTEGPATASEIGARLGQDELLLYYHLKKLCAVGLIEPEGTRATATKPETIYAARAPGVADDLDLSDPATRLEMQRNVSVVLKTAAKEYGQALESLQNSSYGRTQLARLTVALSPEDREELRGRVNELTEWALSRQQPHGSKYAITIAISPLIHRDRVGGKSREQSDSDGT